MKSRYLAPPVVCLLVSFTLAVTSYASEITPAGAKLSAFLDDTHVESLWLARQRVHWNTGEPRGEAVTDDKPHTHCSAFVAATAMKLGIYILRPPDHSADLLANAQLDWLRGEGASQGWKPVSSPIEAQHLANQGYLVVAGYKSTDPTKSGHIAIVRPSTKSDRQIAVEGPQIIQAGKVNYNSTTVREGFKHHPLALREGGIPYFAHAL